MSRRQRRAEASPVSEATREPVLGEFRLRLLRLFGTGSVRRTALRIQADVKRAEAAAELMALVARSGVTVRATRTRNADSASSQVVVVHSGSTGETSLVHASSLGRMSIAWDGTALVIVTGHDGGNASWPVVRDGIGSRYRAEIVAATARRPAPVHSRDEGIAEIALVGGQSASGDIVFLDRCSRVLAEIPSEGFKIHHFEVIAEAAGLTFASYRLTGPKRRIGDVIEALFPRSDRFRRIR